MAEMNRTVWRNEVLARQHERTITQLADDLRRAEDKSGVLARFPFQSIAIPRTEGAPESLPLGMQRQRFHDANPLVLSREKWLTALAQFEKAGWRLIQSEWHHEKFFPPSTNSAASSEFDFELHGEQASKTNRFVISGTLIIEWEEAHGTNELVSPRHIVIRDLSLIERTGKPGFNKHLLLAPEPDRPNGQINLHPVIVTDINRDQHDDIVLPAINKVLLNDGRAEFTTTNLIDPRNFNGVQQAGVMADFNGDGHLDYLGVGELGPMAKMVVLYPGSGSIPFTTAPTVVWEAQRTQFNLLKITHASVVTAGDIDHDGDLDVCVAQYRPPYVGGQLPTPYYDANDGFPSYLLLNDGHGKFAQAEEQPALRAKNRRRTLAASFVDIDGDGDLDLVTLNDYSGVDLFYNDGKGRFIDETTRLDNRHLFGMGLAFADFDRDGALDFLATGMNIPTVDRLDSMKLAPEGLRDRSARRSDMAHGNRAYVSRGRAWTQPSWAQQLARSGWSWGVGVFDFDNDGALDVYVANGHVSGESIADYDSYCWTRDIYLGSSRENPELQRYFDVALDGLNTGKSSWAGYLHNKFFLDVGSNHYVNAAFLMDVAHESDCRAVVSADFNEDGRPDLVVTEAKWQGTPNIMRHRLLVHLNETDTSHHWIGVRLAIGAPAIGAKVILTTDHGTCVAHVVSGDSFQSQQPNALLFGLGGLARVRGIRVVWPNGKQTALNNPASDRWHVVAP